MADEKNVGRAAKRSIRVNSQGRTRADGAVHLLSQRLWALSHLHAVVNGWENTETPDGSFPAEDTDRAVGIIEQLLREEAHRGDAF